MKNRRKFLWIEVIIALIIVGIATFILAGLENNAGFVHEYVCNMFVALAVISAIVLYIVARITARKRLSQNIIIYLVAFFILSSIIVFAIQSSRFNEHINMLHSVKEFDVLTGRVKTQFSEQQIKEAATYWKPMYFEYFKRYVISSFIITLATVITNIIHVKIRTKK